MLSRYRLIVLILVAGIACFSIIAKVPHQNGVATDQQILGVPFEIKHESRYESIDKWYIITLVLPRQYYSKENLERIFQYYSDKNPDLARIVRVVVFADPEIYERSRLVQGKPTEMTNPRNPDWDREHAHYQRECQNEYYWYSPDLDDPSKQPMVILKGKIYGMPIMHPCK